VEPAFSDDDLGEPPDHDVAMFVVETLARFRAERAVEREADDQVGAPPSGRLPSVRTSLCGCTCAASHGYQRHVHSLALFTTYYNFAKVHSKLRMSPAMAAGVADRLWDIGDIVALVEAAEAKPAKRGPYRKRIAA